MAPGIMFLGAPATETSTAPTASAADGGREEELLDAADSERVKQEQETKVMAEGGGKEPPRPDSPGYFTLSDSDGASNPGTESPQDEDGAAVGKGRGSRGSSQPSGKTTGSQHQVYKMFKSPGGPRPVSASVVSQRSPKFAGTQQPAARPNSDRAKSKTPPRPSPPRGYYYNKRDSFGSTDPVPPRPPPPLSYTSTLPPPVPKKTRSKTPSGSRSQTLKPASSASQQAQDFKTLPASKKSSASENKRMSGSATTPLSRVQPLQVQSPSMIQALTRSAVKTEGSPSPPPPLPAKEASKPKTFVQAFQRANEENAKKAGSTQNRKSPAVITPRQTKTSVARASSSAASKSARSSPLKDSPRASSCEPSSSSRRNSSEGGSLKKSSEALRRTVMESLQSKKREKKDDKSGSTFSLLSRRSSKQSLNGDSKTEKKSTPEPPPSPKNKSPSPRRSSKSLSATAMDKIKEKKLERRNSKEKARREKSVEGEEKQRLMHFPNPINSLIKHYEQTPAGDSGTPSPAVGRRHRDSSKASSNRSSLSAGQISRLSQMSADQLNSWLSSPISMTASLDKSITEIDVLDQCVSEMMSFASDALLVSDSAATLTPSPNSTLVSQSQPKSGLFLSMLEHHKSESRDEEMRKSVQEIIDKIELNSKESAVTASPKKRSPSPGSSPPIKPERTKKRDPSVMSSVAPSDDDLSHGVFTEVSFAGSFSSMMSIVTEPLKEDTEENVELAKREKEIKEAEEIKVEHRSPDPPPKFVSAKAPPVPSPRTKRRARKEQMLQQHKTSGKEALFLLKSQSAGCVPQQVGTTPMSASASASHQDGLECLEQLCSISKSIENENRVIGEARKSSSNAGSSRDNASLRGEEGNQVGAQVISK